MKGNKSLCPALDVDVGDNKIVVKSIGDPGREHQSSDTFAVIMSTVNAKHIDRQ